MIGRLILLIFITLVELACYWQIGKDQSQTLQVTKCLFFVSISQMCMYEFTTALEFQKDRAVFIREYMNNMYGKKVYYISKLALELPLLLLFPVIENVVTFWGIGYRDGAFFDFLLVMMLTAQCGTAMGYFISCLFDNMMVATVMTVYFVMPAILFGGLVRNLG